MEKSIFILTKKYSNEMKIKEAIGSLYETNLVTTATLMVELYKKSPIVLIVDLDSFEESTIEMIQSVVAIDYLPVIYTYEVNERMKKILKNEIVLHLDKVKETIIPLVNQSSIFKSKYDKVMDSYNAIDLINGEFKTFFKDWVNNEDDSKIMMKKSLDLVYAKNLFLNNKPEIVWILTLKNKNYYSIKFNLIDDEYFEEVSFNMSSRNSFNFDIYAANGFSKNFNTNELSDISIYENNFPHDIEKNTEDIRNFAGFTMGKIIIIGMNYKQSVFNFDVGIMKALAINFDLLETVKSQMNELEGAFDYTTNALARAAEANDDITGQHIKRVNTFAKLIAEELEMDKEFVKRIYNSSQMHDVGKIYVEKEILTKPGKLSNEEFEKMKMHTIFGEKIVGDSEYLKMSAEIARYHHEKFDGSGYPDGKKGEEIPLSARIVSLADIYDALRSARSYKPAFTHEEAYKIIVEGDGRVNPEHFDPSVLEAFRKNHLEFNEIYKKLAD
ncbi:HD-GYP domain-containing protein [Clostridium grantii]|uniref:HD domain-containing protein n=1 Tax=Clostridium grantii DSM 8605 TaxID=1121316 RepID=A0A1M5WI54_9CLOT|nr:HD domain-containing phosphohydrolase [Clostridium grantii]SHH86894.1 HD domain-containing protein [Clostridium grantii DSM 8605]